MMVHIDIAMIPRRTPQNITKASASDPNEVALSQKFGQVFIQQKGSYTI